MANVEDMNLGSFLENYVGMDPWENRGSGSDLPTTHTSDEETASLTGNGIIMPLHIFGRIH